MEFGTCGDGGFEWGVGFGGVEVEFGVTWSVGVEWDCGVDGVLGGWYERQKFDGGKGRRKEDWNGIGDGLGAVRG
jgi:hypothetical protein